MNHDDKGVHGTLDNPYLFIDTCVQIWRDANYATVNMHGVTAFNLTAWRPHAGPGEALDEIAHWYRVAHDYPESVRIAFTAEDIEAARAQGQAALILGTQCSDYIGERLHRLEVFHRLGLRIMILAYNHGNTLCDGCLEPRNGGLTRMGRRVVDMANRLGVLLDLTHTGERTTFEIMERSQQPVAFTHSNPRRLVDNPRNISDEQMKRCAAMGGVIGVTNWAPIVLPPGQRTRPTLDQYLDHVQYVVELVGIDHVGIGTDFSLGTYPDGDEIRGRFPAVGGEYSRFIEASPRSKRRHVQGFDDYSQLLQVAERLQQRGWSQADTARLFGLNWLRLFRQVWRR